MLLILGSIAIAAGQSESKAILINPDTAKWTHEKGDPAGSESVMLRDDPATGGMELLVRFPAGHVIAPHWHESNERIIVLEGQMTLRIVKIVGPLFSTLAGSRSCLLTRSSGCPVVQAPAALSIFPGTANPSPTRRNRPYLGSSIHPCVGTVSTGSPSRLSVTRKRLLFRGARISTMRPVATSASAGPLSNSIPTSPWTVSRRT